MTKVYIDFESRSQANIWDTGAYRYAEDPTTEILCLAWAIDDGPVQGAIHGQELTLAIPRLNQLIKAGAEFHAHNAFFERCIWKFCLTPRYGALPIPITQWRCTAAKVSAHALPRRLEHAALALGCPHQKDMEGSKLMRTLCTTTGIIDPAKLQRLLLYCKRDVETERDIDKRLDDLSPAEQRVWFLDQYINDTGIRIDVDAVQKAANIIETETKILNEELFQLSGGTINAGTQTAAIKKYLESKGVKLPNLTKATVKQAVTEAGGHTLRILQLRQQLSLTSNAKYTSLLAAVSKDGRIRDTLVYHGASTGRWSGKLVQIQNLVKATMPSDNINVAIRVLQETPSGFSCLCEPLPTLSSCIRGMFIPSENCEMFITDFAAIEARVVLWLAQDHGVELFTKQDADPQAPDIYVHMARAIHNNPLLTKKDKKARQLGKQTVLGCGYGMGPVKFQETCEKYEVDLGEKTELIIGRDDEEYYVSPLAVTSVAKYRSTFTKVVQFWYAMEDTAKKTVLSGTSHQCGYITWRMKGEFLQMVLPSGRVIVYHRPKITPENKLTYLAVHSVTDKYCVEETWGGKLVENATQAVARDIMVESMFRLVRQGFRILFTVHDELVIEAPVATKTPQDVINCVREIPAWATGCPINAECEKTERYKK